MAPPDWVLNEPILHRGDDFYITAFYQLSSCRQIGDLPGNIPWTAIIQYADRRGLDINNSETFEHIIRKMDGAYIEWYAKRQKSYNPKVKK